MLKNEIMSTIKRYPNRKLYDTKRKKYVNLETIADLIRQGEEILVIDNQTGEDITAVTLTQIIMDREKKVGDFLPRSILAALIQAGGESLDTIRQKLIPPLDFVQQVDEEINRRLQRLIQRGEIAEETGKRLHSQLFEKNIFRGSLYLINEEDIEEALQRHDIPSRKEFQQLIDQIDALSAKLDELKK